ncbi:MAG: hypothetical protein ACFFC7_14365 [Candidatus Hermodarchaeota archaeon]
MLRALWIIFGSGLCAYHVDFIKNASSSMKGHLVSGFMSAIFSFSEGMGGGELESVKMKNEIIHYVKTMNDTIICATTNPRIKKKKVSVALLAIGEIFHKYYPPDEALDNNDSRVLAFERELSSLIKQRQYAPRTPYGQKMEAAFQSALEGELLLEKATKIAEEITSIDLCEKDNERLKTQIPRLFTLAEKIKVGPEIIARLKLLQKYLSDGTDYFDTF